MVNQEEQPESSGVGDVHERSSDYQQRKWSVEQEDRDEFEVMKKEYESVKQRFYEGERERGNFLYLKSTRFLYWAVGVPSFLWLVFYVVIKLHYSTSVEEQKKLNEEQKKVVSVVKSENMESYKEYNQAELMKQVLEKTKDGDRMKFEHHLKFEK